MKAVFKQYTKKAVNDAVGLVNAREYSMDVGVHTYSISDKGSSARRTAEFDVISAWNVSTYQYQAPGMYADCPPLGTPRIEITCFNSGQPEVT